MAIDRYDEFIQKALLDPIRSALIVDDDYPTYDEILATPNLEKSGEKKWKDAPQRTRDLISQFRNRKIPLLVDIHDGRNVPAEGAAEVAKHLHQSDLLVLDYELNPNQEGDGTIAINILRNIAANNHFNLVIIYTSMELEKVFQEVQIGLLSKCRNLSVLYEEAKRSAQARVDRAEEKLIKAEDELLDSIGNEAYLAYRLSPSKFWENFEGKEQPTSKFHDLCEKAEIEDESRKEVLTYMLGLREQNLQRDLSPKELGSLSWRNTEPPWIQSDSVFVAFAKKGEHDRLMDRLRQTLSAWSPPPSRLFLSRLRAEIDENGFAAQESVLGRRRALAFWYNRLLSAGGELRRQYVADSMRSHADLLLDEVLPEVSAFANELVEFENSRGQESQEICCVRYQVDLRNPAERQKALIEHNVLVCSRPVGGRYLTTGHVFRRGKEHWICLSPACDLVPGQGSSIRKAHFGDWTPFIAVLLHPGEEIKTNKERDRFETAINDGRYIFLSCEENEYQSFLFTKESNSQPVWQVMYARAEGMFRSEEKRDRITSICWTETSNGELSTLGIDVEVVAQLRYEYALNLLNRMGGSFTRVGLDFVGKIV